MITIFLSKVNINIPIKSKFNYLLIKSKMATKKQSLSSALLTFVRNYASAVNFLARADFFLAAVFL